MTNAVEALAIADQMGSTDSEVRAHIERMPPEYARAVAPRTIVRHALLLGNLAPDSSITTRVAPAAGDSSTDELDIVGTDRPGLFAKVAGVLALNGGAIVSAAAFARDDGIVVDVVNVRPPGGAGGSWWARVEGDLTDAASGRLAVRARVAAMARADDDRVARRGTVATAVRVVGDEIEVTATDRLGVLYAITSALAELGVDIISARISSDNQVVHDRFNVRSVTGKPIDNDHASEIVLAIQHAVGALSR